MFPSNILNTLSALLLSFFLFLFPATGSTHARTIENMPDIPYLLADTTQGSILASNRPFERWHPASLTKLMTAYVVFRAIELGEIEEGSPVTMTPASRRVPPTRMGYPEGAQLRFESALKLLIVKSANDVAIAVAESLSGSVDEFVLRMNAEASRLGMRDTRFANPHGLHDAGQYTTANDLVLLSSALIREYPQYAEYFRTASIEAAGKTHYSYNLLLDRFEGADGMKTGFVCASGYNIVASAERDGKKLVAIVLGADSQTERAVTSARLLSFGFEQTGGEVVVLDRPQQTVGPANLRATMCSETARQNRYDPAPQFAKIESAFLQDKTSADPPASVSLGGIDGPPAPGWLARVLRPKNIPVPTQRPNYVVVDVNGERLDTSGVMRGSIPVPLPSPLEGG